MKACGSGNVGLGDKVVDVSGGSTQDRRVRTEVSGVLWTAD